jgi:FkbM family methyltransferase
MSTRLADAPALAPSTSALSTGVQPRSLSFGLFRLLLRLAWPLTKPLRWYWLNSKRKLGKKLLVDRALKHFLPAPPAGFHADLPHGGRVFLHYREDIGLAVLMSGGFESTDIELAVEHARPDSVAFDVGANVGMFTIPLAHAVGARGRVVAVEPSPDNVQRLEENIRFNGLSNVRVEAVAVIERAGSVSLHLGNDPAFHSTTDVDDYRDADSSIVVPGKTLDGLWQAYGEPDVSFVKVDTEGGELSVLRGASELLSTAKPVILVEAKGDERVRELDRCLGRFDYVRMPALRLSQGNFVYTR